MNFPIPANESRRLVELRSLRSEEWSCRSALNEICWLVSRLTGTPISLISLVDQDEQYFPVRIGLDADRTSREVAFCAHTIMAPDPLVVENAFEDARFANNPLVTSAPGIGAYAGIPLETAPGVRVGALCAIDLKPRKFDEYQIEILRKFALVASSTIKYYRMQLELSEELIRAAEIQKSLLPSLSKLEHLKSIFPLEVCAHYESSEAVGGDVWGIEQVGDSRILVYNADLAGHGLGAALNAVRLHSFINSSYRKLCSPSQILSDLNNLLHDVLPVGHYATMHCGIIDFQKERIEFSTAGFAPHLIRSTLNSHFELINKPATPLGIIRDCEYENSVMPFCPGAQLILFSDALVETPTIENPIFTLSNLQRFINAQKRTCSPEDFCTQILCTYNSGILSKPSDDLTLIAIKHRFS